MNWKQTKSTNLRPGTTKLMADKVCKCEFMDIVLGSDVLNIPLKVKLNEWNCIKLNSFYKAQKTTKCNTKTYR